MAVFMHKRHFHLVIGIVHCLFFLACAERRCYHACALPLSVSAGRWPCHLSAGSIPVLSADVMCPQGYGTAVEPDWRSY